MTTASYHRTFHTRLHGEISALDAWANLFGRAERQIHVRLSRGEDVKAIARTGYAGLGLNAKQFEHAMISVRGKRDAVAELAKLRVGELKARIKGKEKTIKQRQTQVAAATQAIASATRLVTVLEGKIRAGSPNPHVPTLHEKGLADLDSARERRAKARQALHQHRRRLATLNHRLSKAESEVKNPSLCFGAKRLFKAQHRLEESRLGSHADWREEWRTARTGHVLVVGDAIQSSGNAFAKLHEAEDGSFSLELRLPPGLAHLAERRARMLSSFAYAAILNGLKACAIRHGVAVRPVNPAYTSLIGRLKFARRYGLSVHASAALAIGRRAMTLSERPPRVELLDGAVHGTPRRPEDRRGHVWRVWARLARETAAHAARGRAGRKAGSGSVEARARTRPTGAIPSSPGRPLADRATTGPTAWPVTVGVIPAVHRNRDSTAESG